MQITTTGNLVVISNPTNFNARSCLKSGQAFRFNETAEYCEVWAGKEYAKVFDNAKDKVIIECTNPKFFVNYFDLSTDYGNIIAGFGGYPALQEVLSYSNGVRLLNQDLPEVIVGFIISANNNIPRIRKSVENICNKLAEQNSPLERGGRVADGVCFPTLQTLAGADEQFFKSAGLGYRAPYMVKAIKQLAETDILEQLPKLSTPQARKLLMTLPGVGPKVADCILIFGLGRRDRFPVDTWIEKVYYKFFGTEKLPREKIADKLSRQFGDKSAYIQQYLFYWIRESKNSPLR
ncbi:MAG: hypothetical protein FWE53_02075 [Firmicutes bacterium]|nr:hypothetical protein [Bacillota bacterium]